MSNPMDEIENSLAQRDMGVVAYRIYQGARAEGSSRTEAFLIVTAWFEAMMTAARELQDEDNA